MTDKKSILQEAEELIHGERQAVYEHPSVDFARTAKMMTGVLMKKLLPGVEIASEDVPLLQVCIKLSRLVASPGHHDSMVDIPGYMGTYEMVMESKQSVADENFELFCKEMEAATGNHIASKLERERYHQNLRAMNINPED